MSTPLITSTDDPHWNSAERGLKLKDTKGLTVYKYELPVISQHFTRNFPANFKPIDLRIQGDRVYMWAIIDTTKPLKTYAFTSIKTGGNLNSLGKGAKYIGTIDLIRDGDELGLHYFYKAIK